MRCFLSSYKNFPQKWFWAVVRRQRRTDGAAAVVGGGGMAVGGGGSAGWLDDKALLQEVEGGKVLENLQNPLQNLHPYRTVEEFFSNFP